MARKMFPEGVSPEERLVAAQDAIRRLRAELTETRRDNLTSALVRTKIFRLAEANVAIPGWVLSPASAKDRNLTVPAVNFSDWHWGEVVRPEEINGVNAYNLRIAKQRLRHTVAKIMALCAEHDGKYRYPGIVVCLGGDMVSGDIHDELKETNEMPTLPVVLDLVDSLAWALRTLADRFGKVFVPCVTGNHGRKSKKPQAKHRQYTNYDWLIYQMLDKLFHPVDEQGKPLPGYDDRVSFLIPDGFDALFRIFRHRYLLTHGDQMGVKGGDGIIGAIGPIMRGDVKMRGQKARIGLDYDTVILGHWHQYIPLRQIMVNGCLKGYDEFAQMMRFGFEPPSQSLWFNHPLYGITYTIQVFAETLKGAQAAPWVSCLK